MSPILREYPICREIEATYGRSRTGMRRVSCPPDTAVLASEIRGAIGQGFALLRWARHCPTPVTRGRVGSHEQRGSDLAVSRPFPTISGRTSEPAQARLAEQVP